MRSFLYLLVQAVWGFPQTLVGLVVLLAHATCPHCRFHGAIVTRWKSRKALSLGPFLFVGGAGDADLVPDSRAGDASDPLAGIDRRLLVHEYGHTIQSLVLGPFYLLVVGLPSVVWLNTPAFSRKRRREQRSYYRFYTERTANWLGERVLGEPSIGFALID